MTLTKKQKLSLLLDEIDKELDTESDIWLDEAITVLERLCGSCKERKISAAPRLAPIPEYSADNVYAMLK